MRKVIIYIAALFILLPEVALAHILKIDKNIGAVLHVDPADSPASGEPATFNFEITDKENKFSLQSCDCTLLIQKNGVEVYNNSYIPAMTYTFPESGVYNISLRGMPKTEAAFASFVLSYDMRVEQGNSENRKPSHLIHYSIFTGGFIALGVLYFKGKRE